MSPNPYAPPDAELGIVGLTLLSVPLIYLSPAQIQLADAVGLVSGLLTLAGLYGFAFHRALGARRFWAAWLPLLVAWDAVFQFVLIPAGLAEADPTQTPYETAEYVFVYTLVYMINLPLYFALYRYAYRSPELWRSR